MSRAASPAPTGLSAPLIAIVRPAGPVTAGTGAVAAVVTTNRRGATPAGTVTSGRSAGRTGVSAGGAAVGVSSTVALSTVASSTVASRIGVASPPPRSFSASWPAVRIWVSCSICAGSRP